jgi:hypothetical protein
MDHRVAKIPMSQFGPLQLGGQISIKIKPAEHGIIVKD